MTYSIVAIDKEHGLMGVGGQSHYFSFGSIVPWACAGKGVVATQALADMRYGYMGLDAMGKGTSAKDALCALLKDDHAREMRQVAFIDTKGRVSTHTGNTCIQMAGHVSGVNFSCQANMMEKDTVWNAMAEMFEQSDDKALDARILLALKAAESEGGDLRGRQSAAMVVTKIDATQTPWNDTFIDIRVEDHKNPLEELGRLLDVKHAYIMADQGDTLLEKGEIQGAHNAYSKAQSLCPEQIELLFWKGVSLAQTGDIEGARSILLPIIHENWRWKELLTRLPGAKMLDGTLVEKLLSTQPK